MDQETNKKVMKVDLSKVKVGDKIWTIGEGLTKVLSTDYSICYPIEKAKLALRQYLLENKSKVRADLEDMRSKSIGNDIYNYVVNYSNSLSFSDINVVIEPIVDANVDIDQSMSIQC